MKLLRSPMFPTAAALALCAALAPAAHAESNAFFSSGPANYCRPALPAFEGLIRTRPLAVQNEGSTNAFVTCAMASLRGLLNDDIIDNADYEINISNIGGQPITVSCTAVAGRAGNPAGQEFDTKTNTIQPGDEELFEWTNADFGGSAIPLLVSYSCRLPPGGSINDMYVRVSEDGN